MSDDNKKPLVPNNPKPEPPRMPTDRIEKADNFTPKLKLKN